MIQNKSRSIWANTLALIVVLYSIQPLRAQDEWKFNVNKYDLRETYIDQQSMVLGVACSTRLKFICTKDSNDATGYLSMQFTIAPSSKIPDFNWSYFEGPDAPVGGNKLMRITLTQSGKRTNFEVSLSGWRSAEIDDGFVFGSGTPTRNKKGYMRKVLDGILGGAESIEVAVSDGNDPSKVIIANYLITGDRHNFQTLLKDIE